LFLLTCIYIYIYCICIFLKLIKLNYFIRLKFTVGPSGKDIFVSSDMFYLEIILEDNGGVKDVKIHHDGKSEPQVQFTFYLAIKLLYY